MSAGWHCVPLIFCVMGAKTQVAGNLRFPVSPNHSWVRSVFSVLSGLVLARNAPPIAACKAARLRVAIGVVLSWESRRVLLDLVVRIYTCMSHTPNSRRLAVQFPMNLMAVELLRFQLSENGLLLCIQLSA